MLGKYVLMSHKDYCTLHEYKHMPQEKFQLWWTKTVLP